MNLKLKGLIAAPHTPMHPDCSINFDMIDEQARILSENDVQGAFICGTTGEGMSLTIDERLRMAEHWVAVAKNSLHVIIHVGHNCLSDCKVLAAHAQKIGATAISAAAPCFFKPRKVEYLVSFNAEVAAAAPDLPFYYYHSPGMTGVKLSMVEFLEAAGEKIPTFVGIKFNHSDVMEFNQCLRVNSGAFEVLGGCDEILLSLLVLGAQGAIGSTFNYAAPVYHRLIDAYKTGDISTARTLQDKVVKLVSILLKFGIVPTGKAMMQTVGLDCGPVRPPLRNLSKEQVDSLLDKVRSLNLFS